MAAVWRFAMYAAPVDIALALVTSVETFGDAMSGIAFDVRGEGVEHLEADVVVALRGKVRERSEVSLLIERL